MSERFECEHNWIIDNNKRNTKESLIVYDEEWNTLDDLCELLNQLQQRIAELEEQLKNAIVPKFKVNDEIFVIVDNDIERYFVDEVVLRFGGKLVCYRDKCKNTLIGEDNQLFATKEEAEQKLNELKGKVEDER